MEKARLALRVGGWGMCVCVSRLSLRRWSHDLVFALPAAR